MKKNIKFIILGLVLALLTAFILVGFKYVFPRPIDISAYGDVAAVLMSDGTVRAKGINSNGDCNVNNLKGISSLITDYRGVTALTKQGTIFDFASDYDYPSKITKLFPVDNPHYKICQTKDGKTYYYESGFDEMTYIPGLDNIDDIVTTDSAYGLKKDGSIVKAALDDVFDSRYSTYDLSYSSFEQLSDIVSIEKFNQYIACLRKDGSVFIYVPNKTETFELMDKGVKQFCILEHYGSSLLLFAFLMENGTVEQINLEGDGAEYLDLREFKDIQKIAINNLGLYGINKKGKIIEAQLQSHRDMLNIKPVPDIASLSAYNNVIFAIKNDGTCELAMDDITFGYSLDEIDLDDYADEMIAVLKALEHTNIKDIKYYDLWNILVLENDGTVTPYDGYIHDEEKYFDLIKKTKAHKIITNEQNIATALINHENKVIPIYDYFHFDEEITKEIISWENVVNILSGELSKYAILLDGTVLSTDEYFTSSVGLLDACSYRGDNFDSYDYILTDTNNLFQKKLFKNELLEEGIIEIAIAGNGIIALKKDGSVVGFGECEGKVENWENISHVYDCPAYACALTQDGEILTTIFDDNWED